MPKFRVWDNKNRKFIKSPIVWFEDDEVRVFLDISDVVDWVEETNVEVMQFTGLKDKNGVEIYEGDVVRHPPTGYSARIESLVDFENGGFYPFADDWDNAPYPKAQECEVIGNIYENPELLK